MVELVCPRCRGKLLRSARSYDCPACPVTYPVVAGIPDLRVFPDPWIGFEEDRQKALELDRKTAGYDFPETVRAYWDMTPSTPDYLAERFVEHVLNAAGRSAEWLRLIDAETGGRDRVWIDLGCGTGDMAAAASDNRVIGIDIAMRWLIVAKKRVGFDEDSPNLVCCCAEALPFENGTFDRAVSQGLLEHCCGPDPVFEEAHRVLKDSSFFNFRTVNRFSLLREPHVGLWGVGFLPRDWADAYVRLRTGQRYLHHRPSSVFELRRGLRKAGFTGVAVEAARILVADLERLGAASGLSRVYELARRSVGLKGMLGLVAPLLEGGCTR